jgi:hypothetical protein
MLRCALRLTGLAPQPNALTKPNTTPRPAPPTRSLGTLSLGGSPFRIGCAIAVISVGFAWVAVGLTARSMTPRPLLCCSRAAGEVPPAVPAERAAGQLGAASVANSGVAALRSPVQKRGAPNPFVLGEVGQ